jgi:hypothetical protein
MCCRTSGITYLTHVWEAAAFNARGERYLEPEDLEAKVRVTWVRAGPPIIMMAEEKPIRETS